jgi:murein tripeptide amidase MpaA
LIDAGKSFEGRDLYGIHMWGQDGPGKPAVYFHGTVHAREWISAMVVEYLTYKLVEDYGSDPTVNHMLEKFDFFIIPFVNPDGKSSSAALTSPHELTNAGFVWSQTEERFWRKNRQPRKTSRYCIGTDGNRNWPHKHWSDTGGASDDPCQENYRGEAPGDTPEIASLVDFTKAIKRKNGIALFIDWHSYGQYILVPYGYSCDARAANHKMQMVLAEGTAASLLASGGANYTYGPACRTLYATTGDSSDYMQDAAGARFSWTIELRPGDDGFGGDGFLLAADQIMPACAEQWDAMKFLIPKVWDHTGGDEPVLEVYDSIGQRTRRV